MHGTNSRSGEAVSRSDAAVIEFVLQHYPLREWQAPSRRLRGGKEWWLCVLGCSCRQYSMLTGGCRQSIADFGSVIADWTRRGRAGRGNELAGRRNEPEGLMILDCRVWIVCVRHYGVSERGAMDGAWAGGAGIVNEGVGGRDQSARDSVKSVDDCMKRHPFAPKCTQMHFFARVTVCFEGKPPSIARLWGGYSEIATPGKRKNPPLLPPGHGRPHLCAQAVVLSQAAK